MPLFNPSSSSGWTDNGATVNSTTATDNFIIGSTSGTAGTSGAGVLGFVSGTAPSTSPTSTVQLYGSATDYAVLVAHFENNYTDSSAKGKTITSTGAGSTFSATAKFGSFSHSLDGTTAYMSIAHDTDFDWSGDFCVEFWMKTSTASTDSVNRRLFSRGDTTGSGAFDLNINTSGHIIMHTNVTDSITGAVNIADNSWHHIALTRSGSSTKIFVDGTQDGSTWTDSTNWNSNASIVIGIYQNTLNSGRYNGLMDDLRIVKGQPVYTSNFTAPSAQISNTYSFAELLVRDESGNITTLSPHNFKDIPQDKIAKAKKDSNGMAWTYHSENNGKSITVDMYNALKDLESVTNKKYIYTNQ